MLMDATPAKSITCKCGKEVLLSALDMFGMPCYSCSCGWVWTLMPKEMSQNHKVDWQPPKQDWEFDTPPAGRSSGYSLYFAMREKILKLRNSPKASGDEALQIAEDHIRRTEWVTFTDFKPDTDAEAAKYGWPPLLSGGKGANA